MNPSTQPNDQHQQDRALLDDFQRELVIEMRQRLKAPDLDNNDLCKFADKCAVFQKIANDCEKTAILHERAEISRERVIVTRERVNAMYHIARAERDTQLEIAQTRAEAAKAKHRPDHPQKDEDDPLAPFGRKKDGTPYTEAEFDQSLNEAIRGIWGLKPVNPKSYMPWEMKRSADGALVASDDPETVPSQARSVPAKQDDVYDDADTADVRAGCANSGRPCEDPPSRTPPVLDG